MLTVPNGLAEFERGMVRACGGEGRKRAIVQGVKMGRRPKLTHHQVKEALRCKDDGEAVRDIARSHNVHNSTISWLGA